MSKTRRLSYRLHEGEALIVGPIDHFKHMIEMYDHFADLDDYTPEQQEVWREMSEWVSEWLGKTAQVEGYE